MTLSSLCYAIKYGNVEEVKLQLKEGADPNEQTSDWNKTRPLILAAASGHRDIIQALLTCPQLDINLPDGLFGNTALMSSRPCAKCVHPSMLSYFVSVNS